MGWRDSSGLKGACGKTNYSTCDCFPRLSDLFTCTLATTVPILQEPSLLGFGILLSGSLNSHLTHSIFSSGLF